MDVEHSVVELESQRDNLGLISYFYFSILHCSSALLQCSHEDRASRVMNEFFHKFFVRHCKGKTL